MASSPKPTGKGGFDCFIKCSICFEQFKDPRFLPCLHSFCHGCLSFYIQTSCRSKENPIGFQCPLCRKFTPAPDISVHPNEWSEHFPINQILFEFSNQNDLMCGACGRDGEKNRATDFCISCMEALCDNCSKYHRKNRASSNHKLCTVKDIQKTDILAVVSSKATCWVRKERSIELYCNDHEEPCCTMCVSTKHRKCDSVETIEEKAKNLRENGACESLFAEVKDTESHLSLVKRKQEENITKLEDNATRVTSEVYHLEGRIVQHIQRLKNDSLDELSRITKEGKEAMTKNIETLCDQIQLMHFGEKALQEALSQTDVEFVAGYHKQKQFVETINKLKNMSLCITLNYVLPGNIKSFEKTPKFAELAMLQKMPKLFIKGPKEIKKYHEAKVENRRITSMLTVGNLIIFTDASVKSIDRSWKVQKTKLRIGSDEYGNLLEYYICDEKLRFKRTVDIQVKSYGIVRHKERLFVSGNEQGILLFFWTGLKI